MEAIKIEVTGNIARVIEKPAKITSGTVGLPVGFTFDSQWEGLDKIAVFQAGYVRKHMALVVDSTAVPMEVLARPGVRLNIGVYGVNEDGSVAIPTIWTSLGNIREGAVPGCSAGTDIGIAKKYYDQAMRAAGEAKASAQKAEADAGVAETAAGRAEEAAQQAKKQYYTTPREKIHASHDEINTAYIWGLYRALMEEYPVKEIDYSIGELEQHAYVISTGERNTYGTFYTRYGEDAHIKKPKYLVLSGIHGNERKTALSTYRFIRDVLRGHNVPKAFKEGATICVMPVGTPSAFDAFERLNGDGVNINRDFSSDTPAIETQAIANWMKDNLDADLFIDVHNSGSVNEIVAIFGAANNAVADMAKKIALRGVDRVIPFWKGYYPNNVESPYVIEDADGNTVVDTKDMPYIFSYSVSANEKLDGTAFLYASEVLGIPSIAVELSTYYGDYSEWVKNKTVYPKETIAAGAEAIGNILIEFYEQAWFTILPLLKAGTPIYNGETAANISHDARMKSYNREVE